MALPLQQYHNLSAPSSLELQIYRTVVLTGDTVPYCRCIELDKYRLQKGDILFARTGATTGKSFLMFDDVDAVFASYLIRISPGKDVLPSFIYQYFQSPDYWRDIASGIDDGNRPNMNGSKLGKLIIPYPTQLAEQRRIVARIEELNRRAEEARKLRQEAMARIKNLFQTELERVFSPMETDGWDEFSAQNVFTIVKGQVNPREEPYVRMPHIAPDVIKIGTGKLIEDKIKTSAELELKSGKYHFDNTHVLYSKIRPNLRKVALPSFRGHM